MVIKYLFKKKQTFRTESLNTSGNELKLEVNSMRFCNGEVKILEKD